MKKHYTFVPCTGPIEFDEGVKVNVMHKGDVATITCMGGGWYWPNDIPVTDWNNIFVLTESPSTPILGAEEVLNAHIRADQQRLLLEDTFVIQKHNGIEYRLILERVAIAAMQTHSAQYRDECNRLRGLVEKVWREYKVEYPEDHSKKIIQDANWQQFKTDNNL